MKKSFLFLFLFVVVFYTISEFKKTSHLNKEEQGIKEAIEYIHQFRENQITHTVSIKDVLKAREQADKLKIFKDECNDTTGTILAWENLGPNDVGGRTRAILVNKNNSNHLISGGVAGGIWQSNDGGLNWHQYGNESLSGISVSAIVQSVNNDIYVGTGEGFTSFTSGNYNKGGAFPGTGIYRSTDNGNTFSVLEATVPTPNSGNPEGTPWCFVHALATHPSKNEVIYAATNTGLYVTQNSGATWEKAINNSLLYFDVKINTNGTIYACTTNNFYISTNNGQTFTDIANQNGMIAGASRKKIAISKSNPNYVYMVSANGCIDKVLLSKNEGVNWETIGYGTEFLNPCSDYCQCWYDLAICVNETNPERIYLGGVNLWAWSSQDGWNSISDVNLAGDPTIFEYIHSDIHDIYINPQNPNNLFIVCDGGIFKSTNHDSNHPTYASLNKNYNITQFYSMSAGWNGEVMAGAQDNGTQLVNYTGSSLFASKRVMGGDGGYTELSQIRTNPIALFAESQNANLGRALGDEGSYPGNFWDDNIDADNEPGMDGGSQFITPFFLWEDLNEYYYLSGNIRSKFFIGSNIGKLWMTTEALNFAKTPTWKHIATFNGSNRSLVSISTNDGNNVYALSKGGIILRILNLDAQKTVDTIKTPFNNRICTSICLDSYDENNLVLSAANYGNENYVLLSNNILSANPTFTSIQANLPKMPVYDVVINPETPEQYIIAATELGIWSYNQLTGCWKEQNSGIGRVPVYRLRLAPMKSVSCKVLYAGTHGRGMFRTTTLTNPDCNTQLTYLNLDNHSAPKITQNNLNIIPNPTSYKSNLQFTLQQNTDNLIVSISDLQGKIIKRTNLGYTVKGKQNIPATFNDLSIGSYIVTIQTDCTQLKQKLLIIK